LTGRGRRAESTRLTIPHSQETKPKQTNKKTPNHKQKPPKLGMKKASVG
jgi:hypothetical protein